MSKFKMAHPAGWFVAGVLVAVLIIPTAVSGASAVLSYTGIEGATGGTHANVTPAGQIEVAATAASQMFVRPLDGTSFIPAEIAPPKGDALIVTSINVWGVSGGVLTIYLLAHGVKTTLDIATSSSAGLVIPFDPGLPVAAGGKLVISSDSAVHATVVGYTVPKLDG
jgi:hypothetical protein